MSDAKDRARALYDQMLACFRIGGYFTARGQEDPYESILAALTAAVEAERARIVAWAAGRWEAEVKNRPLRNIHRRTLDDTWRQVIRHYGGDGGALCGPTHDELLDCNLVERDTPTYDPAADERARIVAWVKAEAQREGNDDTAYTMRRVADEIARGATRESEARP